MKICVISNLKESGYGESTRPYFLARELRKQGHSILHLCHRRKQVEDGISYLHINNFGGNKTSFSRAANFAYLWWHIRQFNPDIVYTHQFNNARWAIATRTLPKAPIVFDAHTSVYFEDKAFGASQGKLDDVFGIEKEICDGSDFIIAASYPTRALLMEQYNVQDKKIFVVENATSIRPVKEPAVTHNNKFICAATLPFDGFPSNEMALQLLFRVAARMNEMDKDVLFRVIGGGVKPQPPTTNIIYTGYVADYEKSLLESDACVAPYPENAVCGGVRNKVCDYMALGKVIISTTEGMRGFGGLTNGMDYLLANTVEDFVQAIISLKNNNELRKKIETNILAQSHNYQWSLRGEQLNSIFKSMVQK